MNEEDEKNKQLRQSERVGELIKSDTFQELLQILALKIKELDTVRDIDDFKDLGFSNTVSHRKNDLTNKLVFKLQEVVPPWNFLKTLFKFSTSFPKFP